MTPEELKRLLRAKVRISDPVQKFLERETFPVEPRSLRPVRIKPLDWDFKTMPGIVRIYEEAEKRGLDLCPPGNGFVYDT
ncbi:MAG: hypothetical protein M1289_02870 [Patescibacteria group bacterium]|nr:hypothetical protein [Patescibacteria group bacterium]